MTDHEKPGPGKRLADALVAYLNPKVIAQPHLKLPYVPHSLLIEDDAHMPCKETRAWNETVPSGHTRNSKIWATFRQME